MGTINILDVNINNLQEKQYEELKKHAVAVLNRMADLITKENFKEAEDRTFYSPAGDCMGTENNCINFAWNEGEEKDIYDILDQLKRLKKAITGNNEATTDDEEDEDADFISEEFE